MSFNQDQVLEILVHLRNELVNRRFVVQNGSVEYLEVRQLFFLAQHLQHRSDHSSLPSKQALMDFANAVGTFNVNRVETLNELIGNADQIINVLNR